MGEYEGEISGVKPGEQMYLDGLAPRTLSVEEILAGLREATTISDLRPLPCARPLAGRMPDIERLIAEGRLRIRVYFDGEPEGDLWKEGGAVVADPPELRRRLGRAQGEVHRRCGARDRGRHVGEIRPGALQPPRGNGGSDARTRPGSDASCPTARAPGGLPRWEARCRRGRSRGSAHRAA